LELSTGRSEPLWERIRFVSDPDAKLARMNSTAIAQHENNNVEAPHLIHLSERFYRLAPCSPRRRSIHAGDRARVWIDPTMQPSLPGEFTVDRSGLRYHVAIDGPREQRAVYVQAPAGAHPGAFHSDRYESRSFFPVRVLAVAVVREAA